MSPEKRGGDSVDSRRRRNRRAMLSRGAIGGVGREEACRSVGLRRTWCFCGERRGSRVRRESLMRRGARRVKPVRESPARFPAKLGIFAPFLSLSLICSVTVRESVVFDRTKAGREGRFILKKLVLDSRHRANENSPRGNFWLELILVLGFGIPWLKFP